MGGKWLQSQRSDIGRIISQNSAHRCQVCPSSTSDRAKSSSDSNVEIFFVLLIWYMTIGIHVGAQFQAEKDETAQFDVLTDSMQYMPTMRRASLLAQHLEVDYGLGKINPNQNIDEKYRLKALNVSLLTQRRLHGLQFPPNCSSVKLLLCQVPPHGLGSVLHHLAYCLIFGYGLNRTVVFDWEEFRYEIQWNDYFYPLTNCTVTPDIQNQAAKYDFTWLGHDLAQLDHKVIAFPFGYILHRQYGYMVPADLVADILPWCDDPVLWWHSLVMRYVLLPTSKLRSLLLMARKRLQYPSSTVGIHIRHTDKLFKEAKYYGLQEYLEIADSYFKSLASNGSSDDTNKAIFLATDDTKVAQQSKSFRHQYTIINDYDATSLAEGSYYKSPRYSKRGFETALVDIYLLAASDYTIVTMSSNVGRLVYEIKKIYLWHDISHTIYSLDEAYNLFGCDRYIIHHRQRAVHVAVKEYKAKDDNRELSLQPGDLVYFERLGLRPNQYFGYSETLQRHGIYPIDCVKIVTKIYDYPVYEEFAKTTINRLELYDG
ncbi:uncharacterized protein TRIADDRAFT_56089 [Trichoplax adhaerens]|uniref:GT23 domain-containing protein n=1 Tax=Trichoplax adhaerens TaxID=10228 RepID=B3RTY5_TRIAD|nr:hypothetical protein TRIADDRAFT_56089 [Trichoplax adhaerens]EDV25707.1 hypothetical protein TRIADDRAFT_56089 [Trichoplax adhaerens]|eukprot:XP_002111740.1 hypothetical protein TRIADDRAFT_56089 [Trichoplax adhaerens]